jgi:hypothetical protein
VQFIVFLVGCYTQFSRTETFVCWIASGHAFRENNTKVI